MPVNETIDLQRRLQDELGMRLDRIILNGIYPELFSDAEAEILRERYERELNGHGGNGTGTVRRAALRAALSEYTRARSHREQLHRLREGSGEDVVELPFLFEPALDMDAMQRLARTLEESL